MSRRVLHLLSQRPDRTGSGVTLDALVDHGRRRGWEQRVLCGLPAGEGPPAVGGLNDHEVDAVRFESTELPFTMPGMSDVMPYPSRRFSSLTRAELQRYCSVWRAAIRRQIERFNPQLIHSHHLWLMTTIAGEEKGARKLIGHCHGTDLRQRELCPDLVGEANRGARRCDQIVTLHADHVTRIREKIGVEEQRLHVVGAGYREDLFHCGDRITDSKRIVYAGKYSEAKGLPSLLAAFAQLRERQPSWELHLAGAGKGAEAEAIRDRIRTLGGAVVEHGQLRQEQLAELFRSATVCVLPSFFEGLPLVLVEAIACGCRIVATDLTGVREVLAPLLGEALEIVPMPALRSIDRPHPDALPAFEGRLAVALERACLAGPLAIDDQRLRPFRWESVFERIEAVWSGAG